MDSSDTARSTAAAPWRGCSGACSGGRQIDVRLEAIRFARDHLLEQRHRIAIAAGGDIDLSEVRQQGPDRPASRGEAVRGCESRPETGRRRRRMSRLQQHRVAAPKGEHFVGPRVAPLRLAACADPECRRRFVGAAKSAIGRAEQLQRVRLFRAGCDEPFEQAGRARRLVPLQIHAREADPPARSDGSISVARPNARSAPSV